MADVTQNTNGADGAASPGALTRVVDGALTKQNAAVDAYVRKLRGWSQGANGGKRDGSPAAALRAAEKQYLAAVTGMGAGVGAAAAAPGVGTALSLAVSTAEMGANLEATALLVLTYAAIHDLDVDDLERRRALFYGVALGNAGSVAVEKIAGRTGPHWAKSAVNAVSKDTLAKINGVLGPHFVTKYGTRRGVLVLGRVAPFGVGAAIGAGGNAAFGQLTIRTARRAFGPSPQEWPARFAWGPSGMGASGPKDDYAEASREWEAGGDAELWDAVAGDGLDAEGSRAG